MKRTETKTETEKQIVYESEQRIDGRRVNFTLEICFFKGGAANKVYIATRMQNRGESRLIHEERLVRGHGTAYSDRTATQIEQDAIFQFGWEVQRVVMRAAAAVIARAARPAAPPTNEVTQTPVPGLTSFLP